MESKTRLVSIFVGACALIVVGALGFIFLGRIKPQLVAPLAGMAVATSVFASRFDAAKDQSVSKTTEMSARSSSKVRTPGIRFLRIVMITLSGFGSKIVCIIGASVLWCGLCSVVRAQRSGDLVTAFGGERLAPKNRNPHVVYDLNPGAERFFIHVLITYTPDTEYGLIVFTDADEQIDRVPTDWAKVLDQRKFLFVAAENAGNDQDTNRRLGLAVLGALEMMKRYRIDPNRVYAAGFSGGARMSGLLGFFQPDIFHGTIQNSGADFYTRVPTVYASSWVSTTGQPYGQFEATTGEIARAKRVRFVLITGTNDFRRGNILDIYNGGFVKQHFAAKLIDVPGLEHAICDAATLSAALDFIESGS